MKRIQEMTDLCKKLKPVIGHKRAVNLLKAYITSETMDEEFRVETFIHMFILKYLGSDLDDSKIFLPSNKEASMEGEFFIGNIMYGDKMSHPIFLTETDYIKHISISGITGGGKTNLGFILLLNLLKKQIPFLVIDWRRSWRDILTLEKEPVESINVYSIGRGKGVPLLFNPLRGPPGIHYQLWLGTVFESLIKSHLSGPGVSEILSRVFEGKFADFNLDKDSKDGYPNFFDALEEIQRMKLRGRQLLWQDSAIRILRSLTHIGPAAQAFNARHPVKLEELLKKPVILELDMELPKSLRTFFSEIILRFIHLYRLGTGESEQLKNVLILEEIHNLFPQTAIEKREINSLDIIFKEMRGFGCSIVSITQSPSLVPVSILANCNTQIYFSLQHEDDIRTAKKALFLSDKEAVYLDRLRVGEAIIKIKSRISPSLIQVPLVPIKRGTITDAMIRGMKYGKTDMD